jgi:thiosulfate/3-mercaptopyruvate sulfurtransferase
MELPTYGHTGFTLNAPEREHLRVMRDDVLSKVGTTTWLVDARSPRGIPRGAACAAPRSAGAVTGSLPHPGATNIPWAKSAQPDGSFRPLNELRELYEGRGIRLDRELIAYCRVGERSSHTWFALTELLGYPDVRNYDGSWTEYGSLAGVPVELG